MTEKLPISTKKKMDVNEARPKEDRKSGFGGNRYGGGGGGGRRSGGGGGRRF